MDKQLQEAVRERIEMGTSESDIIKELVATGYEADEAKDIYETVSSSKGSDSYEDDAQEDEEVKIFPQNEVVDNKKPSTFSWVSAVLIVLLLTIIGVIGYLFLTDKLTVPFLSEAPYDERTLMSGIYKETPSSYAFSNKIKLSLEPREVDTPVAFAEGFEELMSLAKKSNTEIPDEASFKFLTEGRVEIGEEEMRSDITGNMEMLFDFVNFKAGGSIVQINKEVYFKIDKLPSMVQAGIGKVPMNTWINLTEKNDIEDFNDIPLLFIFDDRKHLIEVINSNLFGVFSKEIREILVQLPAVLAIESNDNQQSLVASLADALNLVPEKNRAEAEEIFFDLADMWNQNPFLGFSENPKKQKVNNETVYSYFVEINIDNFVLFLAELDKYYIQKTGESEDLVKKFNEESGREVLEKFNELVTIRFDITPEGSLYRTLVSSKVTSPDQSFEKQFNFEWELILAQQNEVFNITAPADVYPQTLEEIIEAERMEKKSASLKQTLANHRSQAEIYYNQNSSSYAGYCDSDEFNRLNKYLTKEIVCNDNKKSYVAAITLPVENYWCVDSSGTAGEVEGPLDSAVFSPDNLSCPELLSR